MYKRKNPTHAKSKINGEIIAYEKVMTAKLVYTGKVVPQDIVGKLVNLVHFFLAVESSNIPNKWNVISGTICSRAPEEMDKP